MTVRILYGDAKLTQRIKDLTGETLPTVASSEAGAKALVKSIADGFLSSHPLARFILSKKTIDLDDPITEDFITLTVEVIDRAGVMGKDVTVIDIEDQIDGWAAYCNVPEARGGRIAFVSNVDRVYKKNEPTRFIWQVTLSTFIVYSYQRAVLHFPRTQDEANHDMQDLNKRLTALSDKLELNIHTY